VESYRVQTYRDEAQRELAQWIRFSNEEARKHRDGLTTEGMEITGFSGWFVRQFMDQGDVVGYLDKYPTPVSLRRPVASFVRA